MFWSSEWRLCFLLLANLSICKTRRGPVFKPITRAVGKFHKILQVHICVSKLAIGVQKPSMRSFFDENQSFRGSFSPAFRN